MIVWTAKHPQAHLDMMGFIPSFISEEDPRPVKEQIAERYVSGWHPMPGFKMLPNGNLQYPGDPPVALLFEAKLREEVLRFYNSAWFAIVQPDGSFEASRLD